jgi:hypothetical protein
VLSISNEPKLYALRDERHGVSPSQASVVRSHRGPDFSSSASKPQERLPNLKVERGSVQVGHRSPRARECHRATRSN